MKNKNFLILAILVAIFLISPILVKAQDEAFNIVDLTFTPNVPIPIEVNGYDFAGQDLKVSGDFLAAYIVAVYKYAAGFVGIVAMFMLVIAAWRWLFAAGNASKISAAKDMVNSVLIGLALIFGGQLLLSQISEDFKTVKPLDVNLPAEYLAAISSTEYNLTFCQTGGEDKEAIENCEEYQNESQCLGDICHLIDQGDFDDRCIPKFSNDQYSGCGVCPSRCSCDWYFQRNGGTASLRNLDPCDCDEDKKWIDDECEVAPSGGSYYGGGAGGNIPAN